MGTKETLLVYRNIIFKLVVSSQPWCDPLFETHSATHWVLQTRTGFAEESGHERTFSSDNLLTFCQWESHSISSKKHAKPLKNCQKMCFPRTHSQNPGTRSVPGPKVLDRRHGLWSKAQHSPLMSWLSQKGCRGDACTSLFLHGGILYVI